MPFTPNYVNYKVQCKKNTVETLLFFFQYSRAYYDHYGIWFNIYLCVIFYHKTKPNICGLIK